MRLVFLFVFFFLFVRVAKTQQLFALTPKHPSLPKALSAIQSNDTSTYNQYNWLKKSNEWQSLALDAGYYLYCLELTHQKDSITYFKINPGPFFEGISIHTQKNKQGDLKWLQAKELQKIVQDSLVRLLNNGYPFGQVQLQFISDSIPHLELFIKPGPEVRWGSVQIKPEGIIQEKVLSNLIQIKSGELFCENQLTQLQTQLAGQLPFKLLRNPEWAYRDGQADLFLFLERVKMSTATGIIGLQQNPLTQKAALVGELNVQLQNTWQKNERLNLHWRSIAPQTQQLKTSLSWPYIAGSSYGLQSGFSLYKRDSSFLELKGNFGISYLFANNWKLLVQLDYWQSQTISNLSAKQLVDFNTLSYGFGIERQALDFLPNPRRGQQFKALYLVGNKKSEQDDLTWRLEFSHRYFIPLAKRQVFCFSQQIDHIQANKLFSNELFRFGGLERMRGFDEEAFFASTVLFSGIEYRFLLDQFAHVLLFSDCAWLENQVLNKQQTAIYALGLGLVLGSDNGQFRLSYGLGAQFGQPLQFNAGKLHLGYISYF
jgi:translocation and assembly module TamA